MLWIVDPVRICLFNDTIVLFFKYELITIGTEIVILIIRYQVVCFGLP